MRPLFLTLLTRRDCSLCEEMRAAVDEVAAAVPVELRVCDVDADPALLAQYGEEVPVLLVEGRRAFKYRVRAAELRRRLGAERRRQWVRGLRRRLMG